MTAYQVFLFFLSSYILLLLVAGVYFSSRQKTGTDFWLAGKKAGSLSIGFSAAASWLTAGALLAVTGFFMLQGMGSIWGFVAPNILALIIIGLFTFVVIMAFVVMTGASEVAGVSVGEVVSQSPSSWWNPMSLGMPMVIIFLAAIVPGWISEQDPWQKVWAAKDDRSARKGMFIGALLVTIVFLGCAIIALGLNTLYPEIAKMGFPMGMAAAEPALLNFILDSGFSNIAIAACGVALATAAMSCADTLKRILVLAQNEVKTQALLSLSELPHPQMISADLKPV